MEEQFQKYLLIIGSLVVFGVVFLVLYSFLTASPGQRVAYEGEKITIQWEVLEMPILNQLNLFPKIVLPSKTLGRDDPLSETVEEVAE